MDNVVKVTGTTPLSGESELGMGYGTLYFSTEEWFQLKGRPCCSIR